MGYKISMQFGTKEKSWFVKKKDDFTFTGSHKVEFETGREKVVLCGSWVIEEV